MDEAAGDSPLGIDQASFNAPARLMAVSDRYRSRFALRAAIQAIPYIGGPLDTIFAGLGGSWQEQRLQHIINDLTRRLDAVERAGSTLQPSEELFDLVVQVFDQVVRARSIEKRLCFSNIVMRKLLTQTPWKDAETATRLMSQLVEDHVRVLVACANAPIGEETFDGLRVIRLGLPAEPVGLSSMPPQLEAVIPQLPEHTLRLLCSELVGTGLLHDEGIGRWGSGALEIFSTTETTDWFLGWVTYQEDTIENA